MEGKEKFTVREGNFQCKGKDIFNVRVGNFSCTEKFNGRGEKF